MDESLTERRRVMDEVLRDVNIFYRGESLAIYLGIDSTLRIRGC